MVTLINTLENDVQYEAHLTPNEFVKAMNIAKKNIPNLYFETCQKIPNLSTIVKENFSKKHAIFFEYLFGNKINITFSYPHIMTRMVPKNFLNRETVYIDFLCGDLGKTENPQLARVFNSIDKKLNRDLFLDYNNPLKLIIFKDNSLYDSNKTIEDKHKLKDLFMKKLK